jgi:hypothetical protein
MKPEHRRIAAACAAFVVCGAIAAGISTLLATQSPKTVAGSETMNHKIGRFLFAPRTGLQAGIQPHPLEFLSGSYAITENVGLRIYGLEVLGATLPYTWYTSSPTTPAELIWDSGGTRHRVVVPYGYYNSETASTVIPQMMHDVDGNDYTMSVSDITGMTTITETNGVLFLPVTTGATLGYHSLFLDPCGLFPSVAAASHTGTYVFNADPITQIGIKIFTATGTNSSAISSQFETNVYEDSVTPYSSQFGTSGVIVGVADVNVDFGSVISYYPKETLMVEFIEPLEDTANVHIVFYGNNAKPILFNGANPTVMFKTYYERVLVPI